MGSRFRGNDDWGARPYVGHGTASTPPLWIPAPYRGTGHAFAGMTDGGSPLRRSVEDGEGPRPAAPGFPLSRERRLGSPPLGSRFRGNDGWGSPLRRGPPRTGRDHARSTVWAKVAARAQGPACGESCRVSGQTSAALWLPAGTAPLLRILPGWGSLYRQCTTRHH